MRPVPQPQAPVLNILDHHLPGLVKRAEALEAALTNGWATDKAVVEVELNRLNAYWTQLQVLATQQGVWLGGYDELVERLLFALVRSRQCIERMAASRGFWRSLLTRVVQIANVVFAFFRLGEIGKSLLGKSDAPRLPPSGSDWDD